MKWNRSFRFGLGLLVLAFSVVGCVRLAPPITTLNFPADIGGGFTITLPGHIPEEPIPSPILQIDQFILAQMEEQHVVGLGLGVVRGGEIFYLKGYGWQDREFQVPVRSRVTRFRWASLSKMITSVAAFQLACPEGPILTDPNLPPSQCLDLSVDIFADYLSPSTPFKVPLTYLAPCKDFGFGIGSSSCPSGFVKAPLDPTERAITLGQLLSHRGGIQHYKGTELDGCATPSADPKPLDRDQDFTDALAFLSGNPLVAKPGSQYCYSTFGVNLAGQVIEDFTGNEFEDQVAARISSPLGLTTLEPDDRGIPNRATGYKISVASDLDSEGDIGFIVAPPEIEVVRDGDGGIRYKLPGGGFLSTVEDLTRFCQGLVDESLLSEGRKEAMWAVPEGATANSNARHGFFVGVRNGHRQVAHTGEQQKATARLQLYPDEGLCVVVMTNTRGLTESTDVDISAVVNGVEDIVRSLPITDLTSFDSR